MKKNRIRLTESQLHNIINECVRKILKEDVSFDEICQQHPTIPPAAIKAFIKHAGFEKLKHIDNCYVCHVRQIDDYYDGLEDCDVQWGNYMFYLNQLH